MTQYRQGGFRTSEMLLAPLVPAIRYFVQSPIEVAAILKGIHWLFGFSLLLLIHAASQPLALGSKTTYFFLFMMVALLLPTNLLALKIFNYDKLSMFLGLLGVIYVIRALSHGTRNGTNKNPSPFPEQQQSDYRHANGNFDPGISFNGNFVHFESESFAGHLAQLILMYIAIFVTAIPSAVWLMMVFLGWNEWRNRDIRIQPAILLLILLTFTMLAIPVLFALTQTPAGTRYFNLFIFGFVLFLTIRLNAYLRTVRAKFIVLGVLVPLMLIEVVTFKPVYGAFAPFWFQKFDVDSGQHFQRGHLGPVSRWWGWGE